MGVKYHPKLLELFSPDQLQKLLQNSSYKIDKYGYLQSIFVWTDRLVARVECNYRAGYDVRIRDLDRNQTEENIHQDDFWQRYINGKPLDYKKVILAEVHVS